MKTITQILGNEKEMERIVKGAKGIRRKELEIAQKVFEEWQETKFGTSVMELEYKTYLQVQWANNI